MDKFPFYTGQPREACSEKPAAIPVLERSRQAEARAYIAEQGLVDAVNVMLILGQPLLLTGEPGTGKTQLAYSVGCELGFNVLKFETKSTSAARDLFYTYDTLGRFHAAQLKTGSLDSKEYITYNALGLAILLSRDRSAVEEWAPESFEHTGPLRSIVLIDEIDKAPRDFPNDLLNEIENLYFKAPELGIGDKSVGTDQNMRPIIIITSNSEKNLPDAFLRRCVYYNIPFPGKEQLREIVLSHLPVFKGKDNQWIGEAIEFFLKLRGPNWGLDKRPATAELLNWLTYLRERGIESSKRLRAQSDLVGASLTILFKSADDQEKAQQILSEWLKEP
jgi:MoxR-like ATPase